jgi:hypothetical protein
MTSTRRPGIPSGGLSLEPLEHEKPAQASDASKPGTPSKFHANTRDGGDRREGQDRREMLRFQDDRRAGKDRRPRKSWQPGKNL